MRRQNRRANAACGGWIGWVFDKAWIGGIYAGLVFLLFAGVVLAYDDLTDPHCDGQLMGPGQLCSVMQVGGGRSTTYREHLNPAGSTPVVLTLPGYRRPEKIWHATYDADLMRSYHRTPGWFGVAMAALPILVGVFWRRQRRKAKRARIVEAEAGTADDEAPPLQG